MIGPCKVRAHVEIENKPTKRQTLETMWFNRLGPFILENIYVYKIACTGGLKSALDILPNVKSNYLS